MEWAEGIQNAINYIEDNICDELDIENIAAQAACSPYYFQKIFGIMCGMTVGEYIRSRKGVHEVPRAHPHRCTQRR